MSEPGNRRRDIPVLQNLDEISAPDLPATVPVKVGICPMSRRRVRYRLLQKGRHCPDPAIRVTQHLHNDQLCVAVRAAHEVLKGLRRGHVITRVAQIEIDNHKPRLMPHDVVERLRNRRPVNVRGFSHRTIRRVIEIDYCKSHPSAWRRFQLMQTHQPLNAQVLDVLSKSSFPGKALLLPGGVHRAIVVCWS